MFYFKNYNAILLSSFFGTVSHVLQYFLYVKDDLKLLSDPPTPLPEHVLYINTYEIVLTQSLTPYN